MLNCFLAYNKTIIKEVASIRFLFPNKIFIVALSKNHHLSYSAVSVIKERMPSTEGGNAVSHLIAVIDINISHATKLVIP